MSKKELHAHRTELNEQLNIDFLEDELAEESESSSSSSSQSEASVAKMDVELDISNGAVFAACKCIASMIKLKGSGMEETSTHDLLLHLQKGFKNSMTIA